MKTLLAALAALLIYGAAQAGAQEVPAGVKLQTFKWQEWGPQSFGEPPQTSFGTSLYPGEGEGRTIYCLDHHDASPLQLTLRVLGSAITSQITSAHYAITGKIQYDNVPAGSYLEMWSYFAPAESGGQETSYFSRTLADSGPMAKMEGTDDGREFLLPFDASGAKTKLVRIEFNLHLNGKGTVGFWDVALVQYPNGASPFAPAPTEKAPPPAGQKSPEAAAPSEPQAPALSEATASALARATAYQKARGDLAIMKAQLAQMLERLKPAHPAVVALNLQIQQQQALLDDLQNETSQGRFDWKSFALGIAAAILAFAGFRLSSLLARGWNLRRHERELRRIASLDS